jgi:hypothetical protein
MYSISQCPDKIVELDLILNYSECYIQIQQQYLINTLRF